MKISGEIEKVAKMNNISIEKLGKNSSESIKNQIYQKYVKKRKKIFLWDSFDNSAILKDSKGWELLSDFVKEKICLMFFDDCDDKNVIKIDNGNDLYRILYEMYGFEFYITNYETNYVICFNHHDCLIGCGTARNWVENLKSEN